MLPFIHGVFKFLALHKKKKINKKTPPSGIARSSVTGDMTQSLCPFSDWQSLGPLENFEMLRFIWIFDASGILMK